MGLKEGWDSWYTRFLSSGFAFFSLQPIEVAGRAQKRPGVVLHAISPSTQ